MSAPINDGGPAFPLVCSEGQYARPGMTLRDWFAGQAITAAGMPDEHGRVCCRPDMIAKWAYDIADAMLAAREGGAK